MPDISVSSLLTVALAAYLLPCMASALTAFVAWQGYRRLHEDDLRKTTAAFAAVAAMQAVLLIASSTGAVPAPLLHALDCASAAVMGWTFLHRTRRAYLISAFAVCGIFGAFTLSWWQLVGAEAAWIETAWSLINAALYGVVAASLWRQRRERSWLLLAAFALLTLGSVVGAAGWAEGTLAARLAAFPLVIVALMQLSTHELENIQSELVSFSEHSLRQTQQLLALLRASTTFLTQSSVATILYEAAEGVALGVDADGVLIALLDEQPEYMLRVRALYPPRPLPNPTYVPLRSQPAIANVVQRALAQQVVLAPSQRGIHSLALLMGSHVGPAIVQPMVGHGRVLGVIVALNGRSRRLFTDKEQQVLEAFGAQVAAAVENALLDEMIEKQTRELAELLSAREEEASRRAAILESIADGVIVFDDQEQVAVANPAARTILGLSEAGLPGMNLREILCRENQLDDYTLMHSLIESGQPLPPGFKVTWNSKTVAVNVAPVKLTSAKGHSTVMVLHDMTQDAEVDRLKSDFVSVVSHELRSPFAELDSSMQLIRRHGLDQWSPEQREQLEHLTDGLKRTRTMINNLVTFASFVSKQGKLRMAPLDMGQLAFEIVQSLEPMARTRGLTVTSQIVDALPVVYGDRDRLTEAIYHLLHNAIKFNRPGGSVFLSCRAASDDVVVEVADTGVGISPEKLPEIWKDFTQLADPLRRGVEGLGLGLPLVRYVVRAHGGQVWARSQPGQGSTFGFYIPAAGGPDGHAN
jgi:two-component system, OmpR family, phosphate regulon sensor histidine kinase PhoR